MYMFELFPKFSKWLYTDIFKIHDMNTWIINVNFEISNKNSRKFWFFIINFNIADKNLWKLKKYLF